MASAPIPLSVVEDARLGTLTIQLDQREWWRWHFAGQLLAGLFAANMDTGVPVKDAPRVYAEVAVEAADAIIARLERSNV